MRSNIHGDKEYIGIFRCNGNATLFLRTNFIVHCSIKGDRILRYNGKCIIIDAYILHYSYWNKEQIGMLGCNGKCNIVGTYRLHWSY